MAKQGNLVMQETLVIYLHSEDLSHPSWAVIDHDGIVRETALHDQPEGLAHIAEGKEVIVLVPAEEVSLFLVTLPKMNHSRLLQALPYAIEEQLVSDVTHHHFAPGEYQANGELPVCVVAHEKCQEWLALLKTWQIVPDKMMSALFALPSSLITWTVVINHLALVKTAPFQGFACDQTNLNALLLLAESNAFTQPNLIEIFNFSKQPVSMTEPLLAPYQEHQLETENFMKMLGKGATSQPVIINLLSGKYAIKKSKFPQIKKIWKITTGLAIALAAILLLSPLVSYFILAQSMRSLDQQVAQIYKHHFPQSTSIVAPKNRLEEKLQKLSNAMGDNRLLVLLGYVGKGLLETPGIKLKRFDFRNNQLSLELIANGSDDFTDFTNFLTQQGLNVKQQNVNLNGDRINAMLIVEM